jgi:hypothetical protein
MPWPKGKPRKKVATPAPAADPSRKPQDEAKADAKAADWKKRAGNSWDAPKAQALLDKARGYSEDTWRDRSQDNIFTLPDEALEWLRANDLDAQWITETVYGQRQDRRFNNFLANGWVLVEPDQIPGVNATDIEGTRLVVRPKVISAKSRQADETTALRAWDQKRQYLVEGIPLPTGAGAHPSAIRFNRLNKMMERIVVPRDD